jgi:hypothetical protein
LKEEARKWREGREKKGVKKVVNTRETISPKRTIA